MCYGVDQAELEKQDPMICKDELISGVPHVHLLLSLVVHPFLSLSRFNKEVMSDGRSCINTIQRVFLHHL